MKILKTVAEFRAACAPGEALFVPTMGNLHSGHLSLIQQACDYRTANGGRGSIAASIFVNRLQFAPNEDFDQYPRTFERDCQLLEAAGCDLLFAPDESQLYPQAQCYFVQPDPALAGHLEGTSRPGFFTGVCTVVLKLFNCVQPSVAVFGKKDYQQLAVITRMTEQLALPLRILAGETVREKSGLAMSSRNHYLTETEKIKAAGLYQSLCQTRDRLMGGEVPDKVLSVARQELADAGWRPDYLTLCLRKDLTVLEHSDPFVEQQRNQCVLLAAAHLGEVRLIDNLEL